MPHYLPMHSLCGARYSHSVLWHQVVTLTGQYLRPSGLLYPPVKFAICLHACYHTDTHVAYDATRAMKCVVLTFVCGTTRSYVYSRLLLVLLRLSHYDRSRPYEPNPRVSSVQSQY